MLVIFRSSLVFLSVIIACLGVAMGQPTVPSDAIRRDSVSDPLAAMSSPKILVISAHLDDEIIFFQPWLALAHVILTPTVYPISEFMKSHIAQWYLDPEKWHAPLGSDEHDRAKMIAHDRPIRSRLITDDLLLNSLNEFVASSDVVVSHSPWGEYGHEQHRQIFCVLQRLVMANKKDFYVWNGIPDIKGADAGYPIRYVTLVNQSGELPSREMAYDEIHYRVVRDLFLRAEMGYPLNPGESWWNNRFWTWDRDAAQGSKPAYRPPATAKYYKIINQGKIIYDPDQISAIILETGTFPDDSLSTNCIMENDSKDE